MSLRETLAADLQANIGTSGWGSGLRAVWTVPGFRVIAMHRFAHWLARKHRLAGELVWHRNIRRSGCHLHLDARVGPGVALPHPTGVVVGSGAEIGAGVTLYQNVTIGQHPGRSGYPKIAEGVSVFPGAVIVGPITIGAGAIIGALSYVDRDLPAGCTAFGTPLRIVPQSHGAHGRDELANLAPKQHGHCDADEAESYALPGP